MNGEKRRCPWPANDQLMVQYHDHEWGVPVYDDRLLFEYMVLDAFQAGLSWRTVLHKRENFRKAFDGFDPVKIAAYDEKKFTKLIEDPGIIRNKLKIKASITNAQLYLKMQQEGSFSDYIWQFVGGKPIQNEWKTIGELPARTRESDAMSKDLQKRGFKFVGSTICYAFMQAAGLVNDHLVDCYRHKEVKSL